MVGLGERKLYVAGGRRIDKEFLGSLVLPAGMRALVPGDGASLGEIRLDDWLPQSVARTVAV